MGVFTVLGREVASEVFKEETFFLGVGEGNAQWDSAPVAPLPSDTALVAPVGVTRQRDMQYVTPDEAGAISMADGSKWAISAARTRYLYLEFKLDLADGVPSTLRENGIYRGTELDPSVPAGQFYIPLADVVSLGDLVEIDRFNSIIRDGTLEQSFSTIITF